jgi:hypothetical protein
MIRSLSSVDHRRRRSTVVMIWAAMYFPSIPICVRTVCFTPLDAYWQATQP